MDRPAARAPECRWQLRSLRLRSPSRRHATSFASASIRSPRMSWWSGSWTMPEGPHQLRIGLRRLRSAFSVFSPVLQSPEMTRLNGEARWLGQEVGRLRDLDVVANDIVRREAEAHPDEPGLPALADALSRQAAGTARSPSQASRRGARAGVPDRPGAVRGDARLARSAGFWPDRAACGVGRRVGRQGAEQALEEGQQARART